MTVNHKSSQPDSVYVIHRMDEFGEVNIVGGFVVLFDAESMRIHKVMLQYAKAHRGTLSPLHSDAIDTMTFESDGRHFPGFIDDCLPDDWGERIIAATLAKSHVNWQDILNHSWAHATIGAIKISPATAESVKWDDSLDIGDIHAIYDQVWDGRLSDLSTNNAALKMVLHGGSRAGGARPKLLVKERSKSDPTRTTHWIVKFNRSTDTFNYARMEMACLELCRSAGLLVPAVEIMQLASGREGLKVERFDVTSLGGRFRMATMNSLLKDPYTQDDPQYSSYEDLVKIIKAHSYMSYEDTCALFKQMLINSIVRNTDDHLRNFSMFNDGVGWRLTPVYDIVPNEDKSLEHAIACQRHQYLPPLSAALDVAISSFGLKPVDAESAVNEVRKAASEWPLILERVGLNERDADFALSLMTGRL